ncbi:RNA-binding ATPase activator esf2 [Elasticomyces elasticus]|nr:RNA-binding ATPase activator esf2 [Elasticomyces elasticus]
MSRANDYLDHGVSDVSESEAGYDSEAAEVSRTTRSDDRRGAKRRKLPHTSSGSEDGHESEQDMEVIARSTVTASTQPKKTAKILPSVEHATPAAESALAQKPTRQKKEKKQKTPGVIYLSSLPPYLKPSALRNLLAQRGFEPITRLFLTPASKHKHSSKKSSQQLYSEGWIEFGSKKTAKACAEALNAQLIGGKKGGFYHDDLWNMKYLRGMAWEELMSGIREERREEEGRRDEERRKIAVETRAFVEGVEQGKRLDGIKKKRKAGDRDDRSFTWKQHEVAKGAGKKEKIDSNVQQVLAQIF